MTWWKGTGIQHCETVARTNLCRGSPNSQKLTKISLAKFGGEDGVGGTVSLWHKVEGQAVTSVHVD